MINNLGICMMLNKKITSKKGDEFSSLKMSYYETFFGKMIRML
jgi:hypothetical protein